MCIFYCNHNQFYIFLFTYAFMKKSLVSRKCYILCFYACISVCKKSKLLDSYFLLHVFFQRSRYVLTAPSKWERDRFYKLFWCWTWIRWCVWWTWAWMQQHPWTISPFRWDDFRSQWLHSCMYAVLTHFYISFLPIFFFFAFEVDTFYLISFYEINITLFFSSLFYPISLNSIPNALLFNTFWLKKHSQCYSFSIHTSIW